MRFEVLGPVRAVDEGRVLGPVSSMRLRLLAVLLVRANRVVSTEVLSEALWGSEPPDNPAKSLQLHIHRLRQVLDRSDRLLSVPGGYLLELASEELDASTFEAQLTVARGAASEGDIGRAAETLRGAMALWRGAPYDGIDEPTIVVPEGRRLAELRLIAIEEMYDAELAFGRAREIIPELTELVSEFPLRERFTGQLMLALYRSGRQARAIAAYRAARRRLAEHLKTEPGRELRALHDAILTEDPSLHDDVKGSSSAGGRATATAATATARVQERVIPSQLPPATGAFFGRDAELSELAEQTELGGVTDAEESGVVVLTGMAGVGKTSLAVRHAHRIADRFGDGQLYLDLRGHAAAPALAPLEALSALLRGLGRDPSGLFETLEEAVAEYRSRIAGRKMLVLLDNAALAEQVRPLLPATPGCLAMVTSRNRLSGLVARDGAHRISLGVLTSEEARALLIRLLGSARVTADPAGSTALIDACAGLPLALRIAAAQLADESHRTFGDYVAELQASGLATLSLEDDQLSAVAPAFDLSYQRLEPDVRRTFRLLGLVRGPDFTVAAAAALCRTKEPTVRVAIRSLVSAHLLVESQAGRYTFHDLLRDYAWERCLAEETEEVRRAAVDRLCTWYYQAKEAAAARLRPNKRTPPAPVLADGVAEVEIADRAEADSWLQAEFANLSALASYEKDHGDVSWAWHLVLGIATDLGRHGFLPDARALLDQAVEAARTAGDRHALAHTLTELGAVYVLGAHPLPEELVVEALGHAEAAGDLGVQAYLLYATSVVRHREGETDAAEGMLERVVDIQRAIGDTGGQALALNHLGAIAMHRGDNRLAARRWQQILDFPESRVTVSAMSNLCFIKVQLGWLEGVDELMARAESIVDRLGDPASMSSFLVNKAVWHLDLGRFDEALEAALASKEGSARIALPRYQCHSQIAAGLCYLGRGEPEKAMHEFREVSELASAHRFPEERSDAVLGLAEAELLMGRPTEAKSLAEQAIAVARSWNRCHIGLANITLARASLGLGDASEAVAHGTRALTLLREAGHYLGEARAHWISGDAYKALGDDVAAKRHLDEALRMFEANGAPEAAKVRSRFS